MIQTFRDTLRRAVPPWLSGYWGSRLLYSQGVHMDVLGDMAVDSVKLRFPSLVDPSGSVGTVGKFGEDVLPMQGRDRQIIRGKAETAAVYSSRLQGYRQAHQHRGGPYELLRQVHAYYQGTVTADLVYTSGRKFSLASNGTITWGTQSSWSPTEPSKWARWWLFYHWPTSVPGGKLWDDGSLWDSGIVWDSGFSPEEVAELRTIPQAWNAAHSVGTLVVLSPGQTITGVTWGTWTNQIGIN